jgi:hypothetical protein
MFGEVEQKQSKARLFVRKIKSTDKIVLVFPVMRALSKQMRFET